MMSGQPLGTRLEEELSKKLGKAFIEKQVEQDKITKKLLKAMILIGGEGKEKEGLELMKEAYQKFMSLLD